MGDVNDRSGLEIITAGEPSDRPPLLFVHGSFCGAWTWSEHFLPYFAERGWRSIAVSLRGHGRSAGRKRLDTFGVADYVADVAEASAGLERPPVVVGHSMGGIVAERFATAHAAAGLVLLAPASPLGLGPSFLRMSFAHPDLLRALSRVQSAGMGDADFEAIRRGLFSPALPAERALGFLPYFQRESLRANLELLMPQWPWLMARPNLPVLVAGGTDDCFVSRGEFELTAMIWGAERRVLDGVPHALMLDATWRLAADAVADWLDTTFAPTQEDAPDGDLRERPSRRPSGSRRESSRPASGSARPRGS
jgi:non-heme chloroperoxidase